MELVLGVIVLVLAVIAYVKLQQGIGKAVNVGINNTVARGIHKKGQQLVQQRLTFTAQASVDQVRKAVLSTVNVEPEVPKLMGKVYLNEVTNSRIVYACGNRVQTAFRGVLSLNTTTNGTWGSWEIIDCLEQGGLVTGQKEMARLIDAINSALRSVDPNARLK